MGAGFCYNSNRQTTRSGSTRKHAEATATKTNKAKWRSNTMKLQSTSAAALIAATSPKHTPAARISAAIESERRRAPVDRRITKAA